MKKNEIIELKIEKLAFGGAGIGHIGNYVVFVENTVPGDKIKARLTKLKKNYAQAIIEEFTEKSALRIKPRCGHFDICGGCGLQCLDYKKQLEIKESHVTEVLEHIGGIVDLPLKKIIGCNEPWFYRNKMEFSFGMNASENGTEIGLHPKGMRYDVFGLQECYLESEDTSNIVSSVREFINIHKLKPYHFRTNTGILRSITIREGKRTGERMVILLTSGCDFELKSEFVNLLTKEAASKGFNPPTSIYIIKQIVQKGRRTELSEEHIFGEKYLTEILKTGNGNNLEFKISPLAFFQTNTLQAELLYNQVILLGEITKADTVFDIFCGTGTIGLYAAHKAKKVVGIDLNGDAINSAVWNAKSNNINNAEFIVGDALKTAQELTETPDVVIVDPPRPGLGEKLCEHLCSTNPRRLIYVSCNPSTLARDLECITGKGYKLSVVQPIDMFPHTYHIETVCRLDRE